ncbi:DUF1659 domain-containing protein [Exiguobacterium sp.]|uniref:DUF1659 domain-containing protein n=1 Tax=Exiguobacterium sp. TaxID=44751 RepID=UPI0028A999C6|nr:DUF1659 domain-containing protein [Exiguobacterium sp.]
MTQAEEIKTSLVIVFERKDKVTANGDAVVARRRYNGLRSNLSADVVASIGQAVGSLLDGRYALTEISRDYALLKA